MFSVENFYDFISQDYGYHATKNLVLIFDPHGSKDWHDLVPFGLPPEFYQSNSLAVRSAGRIVMHDQEPFFADYLDTYRTQQACYKNNGNVDNHSIRNIKRMGAIPRNLDNGMWLRQAIGGKLCPIICHSEKHSKDIAWLEDHGFLTCYYWWHGMISRDWFRHWHHYQDLQPKNKSANTKRFLLYARDTSGTRSYRTSVITHCRRYQSQILFNWNNDSIPSDASSWITLADSSSPIHLVAETLFDTEKVYLTEKVFKPMVMSQSFILFAPPHSLKYLRSYGFKTFDSCWDESYDDEINHEKRLQMVMSLINYLSTFTDSQMQDLHEKSFSIIAHNRKRFFSQEFQDQLIAEMRSNLQQCLFEQNKRHQHGLDNKASAYSDDV